MSEIAQIIEAQIEKFDALRIAFLDDSARCFLIKRAENSGEFIPIFELTNGWYFRWSEYRRAMQIRYATRDESFADLAAQKSFFAYGVPDADGQIDVYKIEVEQEDKVAPSGANPYWKFYVVREAAERFTIQDAPKIEDDMPYKVYTASMTQTGTNPPVPLVFENTVGEIVWSRSSQGIYRGTLPGAFPENKVAVFATNSLTLAGTQTDCYRIGDDFVQIQTQRRESDELVNADGILGFSRTNVIEIRIYE